MVAASSDLPLVLIVGAGPTGLAAALSLARAHIPVRLIERALHPEPHSRALGIQARTLELFEQHRLVKPFLEHGHRVHAVNLHSSGRQIARLELDALPTRYPYLLCVDQAITERLMTAHLAALGVMVERGVELIRFVQDEQRVEAELAHAQGGHTEVVHASYLIAADGAHSTVRHLLKMDFVGKTFDHTFLLADLHVDGHFSDSEANIIASTEGFIALFPMGGGRYRLFADMRPSPDTVMQTAGDNSADASTAVQRVPPSLDVCRHIVACRLREPVALSDLRWSSYFRVHSRMVKRLRVQRTFLVGDAAHVHSPAGAQGLNTGVQEAFNLAWKLAQVMAAGAPERLLDTYQAERQPIERDLLRQTRFITRLMQAERGPLKFLRERALSTLVACGPLRHAMQQSVSELAIHYRHGPLTLECPLDGGPRAGERAPDVRVHVIDGPLGHAPGSGCLFDLHDPAFFSLFILLASPPNDEALNDSPAMIDEALTQFATTITAALRDAVRIWYVTDTSDEAGALSLTGLYGCTRPAFYLVRPDGYIGARGCPQSDARTLIQHCEQWFGREKAV